MNTKKYFQFIKKARLQEGENVGYATLILKLAVWLIKNRSGFSVFFHLRLHKKGIRLKDIFTVREFLKIQKEVNPPYYLVLLEDKFVFDRFLTSFNFPLAELEGLIQGGQIRWIKNELLEPLNNIINYNLHCYFKEHLNWGGNKVYKLDIEDKLILINNKPSTLQNFSNVIGNETFVLQKTVIQHPEMSRLNSSCINTLRIITVHNVEDIIVYAQFARIGIRGSIVDNASQGTYL